MKPLMTFGEFMKLEIAGLSDVGLVRKSNEDSYGILAEKYVGLVCDGMGGHKGGAFASDIAVKTILEIFQNPVNEFITKIAGDLDLTHRRKATKTVSAIRLANRYIYNMASRKSDLKGMGTTVVLAAFEDGLVVIGNVGDSRLYRLRDRELQQLTEDHSWVNELIADKEINEEDARFFEKKNVITRALGMASSTKIDLHIEPIQTGDIFLLCTDGLTNSLNNDLIQALIVKYRDDMQIAANHLIDMAKKIDGSDNITVALVKISDAGNHYDNLEPVSITVNEENKRISALENKYLKSKYGKTAVFKKRSGILTFSKFKIFLSALFFSLLCLIAIIIWIKFL